MGPLEPIKLSARDESSREKSRQFAPRAVRSIVPPQTRKRRHPVQSAADGIGYANSAPNARWLAGLAALVQDGRIIAPEIEKLTNWRLEKGAVASRTNQTIGQNGKLLDSGGETFALSADADDYRACDERRVNEAPNDAPYS